MVSIVSLWLPIVLSAVFVFLASFVIHMALRYHANDYRKLPAEDEVMDALRKFQIPPGDYMVPRPAGAEGMKDPKYLEKLKQGPVMVVTVMKNGMFDMRTSLFQWFVYSLLVGVLAAYVAGRALGPGTPYLKVFRFAGVTSFIAYSIAMWQDSIWYHRSWGTTMRNTFDGLVYGLLTAGTFGWLWPK
jgi:hypothetical protein